MASVSSRDFAYSGGWKAAVMQVFIKTFGCQMNKSESERMLALLEREGYSPCDSAEEADLVVANTCSIRGKAEDKLYSLLGEWRAIKVKRPLVIAVSGCIAQQEGETLRKRQPAVDIVLGTHSYYMLPEALRRLREEDEPQVMLGSLKEPIPEDIPAKREKGSHAWVTVMQGCTNFCSYCIVPHTRGPEISRTPDAIVAEVEALLKEGYCEFTLLGQNVNVYGKDLAPQETLGGLLERLEKLPGVVRLRFITSHPRDLSEELVLAVRNIPSACEYFHLPIQAGSDKVLKEMNRRYTKEDYRQRVAMIRKHLPDVAISTDLIVGFPGETEEEFLETVEMVKEIGFDLANTAAYSIRPHTVAGRRPDQISEADKNRRLNHLNKVVKEVAHLRNQARVGGIEEVLVDGLDGDRHTGRSRTNKPVYFTGDAKPGDLVQVKIERATAWSLYGIKA